MRTLAAKLEVKALTSGMSNVQDTCALLRYLLLHEYRSVWQKKTSRTSAELNQAAIARVLARKKIEDGDISLRREAPHRAVKDLVSHMVRRERLTGRTLSLFIEAFDMNEAHQNQLWNTLTNPSLSSGTVNTIHDQPWLAVPQCHRTISVSERYKIDPAGVPILRNVRHTIRAVEDGVGSYIFGHEREVAAVTVRHGGVTGPRHEYGNGLLATEIVLDHPLRNTEATALEYEATYPRSAEPFTEVRRAAFARSENVDIAVEFTGRLPGQAWWCVWADPSQGQPVHEEEIDCRNGSIRKYFPSLENAVAGVRWRC
uniref:Uncharacterized protein n=1 Tax=Streptoalloteichus sp. ATCC 53650 TaxID=756733 RepID=K4P0Y9_9PSEU|nr:hypothetical protein [Streptoalloteichus sp. ATCC 53650]